MAINLTNSYIEEIMWSTTVVIWVISYLRISVQLKTEGIGIIFNLLLDFR